MEKFNRSLALCGIAAAFCLGSCISVTDELDLDKKISLDVQVAPGGLSIPVGSLKEIHSSRLMVIILSWIFSRMAFTDSPRREILMMLR